MTTSTKSLIEIEVDRLFREMGAASGDYCHNPITGASFVWDVDPIEPQKRDAVLALLAREWFAINAKNARGLTSVVGSYARSLAARDWNLPEHPSFDDFACGLMAWEHTPDFIKNDEALRRRFPPRSLPGLGPGLYWQPPKLHTQSGLAA